MTRDMDSVVRGARILPFLLLGASLGACDVLDRALSIEAPSQVPASTLDDPQHAALLVSGAVGDFECAFGSYLVNGALLGNELDDATFTANRWPVPSRTVQSSDGRYSTFGCESLGVYTPVSTARWSADNAVKKLEGWTDQQVPNRTRLIATAAAYSGYSLILLGEGFCSAAVDLGPELTPAQVFQLAVDRFTKAIGAAQASKDDDILNLARIGRARALLNLGQKAQAATDARAVIQSNPAYVRTVGASAAGDRRRNRVSEQNRLGLISVAAPYRNLTVSGVADPRVTVVSANRNGSDAQTPLWFQRKYPSDETPYPLATFREALLIVAEAEGGQSAVEIINQLRRRAGINAAFASTNPAEIQRQVVEERRRELFLESHHLGDLRRYSLPLVPAPGTPYPKGGVYGEARCLPLPDVERAANPNF
jgi:hypothetical protein